MSTFGDAFEAPVKITLDGQDILLAKLSIRDYLPWCADLTKAYQERNLPLIPDDVKGKDRMQVSSIIKAHEFTAQDCKPLVFTPTGIDRVIKISFVRALTKKRWFPGLATDQDVNEAIVKADQYIDTISAIDAEELSVRISGLFTTAELSANFKAEAKPAAKPSAEEKPTDNPESKGTFGDSLPNDQAAKAA